MNWDAFNCAERLIEAGERAALEILPQIRAWQPAPKRDTGAPGRPVLVRS
jgi:hypothetical protein